MGLDLDVEDHAHRLGLHAVDELHKHVVAFPLVFPQGVLLGVAPEADAVPQVVHGEEMILPLVIDDLEHDHLLELAEQFRADLFGLGGQELFHLFAQVFPQVAIQVGEGHPEAELALEGGR